MTKSKESTQELEKNCARSERRTLGWLLVFFIVASVLAAGPQNVYDDFLPDTDGGTIPSWLVPMICGVVLLVSGIYQYTRYDQNASPLAWGGGVLLVMLGVVNAISFPDQSFFKLTLLSITVIIVFGLFVEEV